MKHGCCGRPLERLTKDYPPPSDNVHVWRCQVCKRKYSQARRRQSQVTLNRRRQ